MPATINQKISFRDKVMSIFLSIQKAFEIDPKIPLIQSAIESNWGISELAVDGLNIFGMTPGELWQKAMNGQLPMVKVPTWTKLNSGHSTVFYPTTEYSKTSPDLIHYWDFSGDIVSKKPDGKGGSILVVNRYFRKYLSWEESAWDWARKIAQSARYANAYIGAKMGNVPMYADGLLEGGYATDPAYKQTILNEAEVVAELPDPKFA